MPNSLYKAIWVTLEIIFLSSFVFACSCRSVSPEQALKDASAVFVGVTHGPEKSTFRQYVRRFFPIFDRSGSPGFYSDIVPTTFEVKKVWKGPTIRQIVISHGTNGTSCGVTFQPGVEYLVYAFEWKQKLTTGLCTRTTRLSSAVEDLRVLGEGTIPPPIAEASTQKVVLWTFGILILLTLIVWVIPRIRKTPTQ